MEVQMRAVGVLCVVAGCIIVFVAAIFGLNELGYQVDRHYTPLQEQIRHDTFEQSQSYNEGMIRQLSELRDQYNTVTDPTAKAGIKATFMHEVEGYPNQLPADLQAFRDQLQQGN
jgi:hypothetical protein